MRLSGVFKNAFRLAMAGGAGLFLSACYGVAYTANRAFSLTAKDSSSDEPIPGLRVEIRDGAICLQSALTNAQGRASFPSLHESSQALQALVSDIDGQENGGDYQNAQVLPRPGAELSVSLSLK